MKHLKSHTANPFKLLKFQLIVLLFIIVFSIIYLFIRIQIVNTVFLDRCPIDAPKINATELILSNRKRLKKHLTSFGLELTSKAILLPSSEAVLRDESDMELPGWRQTSNIYYVLGKFSMPDVFVLIKITDDLTFHLILPNYNTRDIVFSGNYPNKTELSILFHLDSIYNVNELEDLIQGEELVTPSKIWDRKTIPGTKNLTAKYSVAAEQAFIESRFIKSELELEMLSYSSKIASYSHQLVKESIKSLSSIATESKLASLFAYVSTVCRCELQAYNPIVGAAQHSAVLHFPTGQGFDDGMSAIKGKEFILIDAAPAYRGYASDLTRTFAANPSEKFQILSNIVLNSQMAGIGAYKMGNKWSNVVNKTLETLTEGLWKAGFLLSPTGTLEPLIDSGVISIFMPHGIGHPVGLDVHDPYPASVSAHSQTAVGLRDQYPLKLTHDFKLTVGMVHTIEPGVYFVPYLLDLAKNNATIGVAHLIDWEVIHEWKHVGGVRIEDVLAIAYDGSTKIITNH